MPLISKPSMLAHAIVGQPRDDSLDDGVMTMVHTSGVIGRFSEDIVCLIIRVVWSYEFATNGYGALPKISHSPSTVEVIMVPLLNVGGKLYRTDPLALTDTEVPEIIKIYTLDIRQ